MVESKKRVMGVKGFLAKANAKVSADGFIAQHREWLVSGELAPIVTPILVKLDNREVFPTAALNEIREAAFNHLQKAATSKEPKAITAKAEKEPGTVRESTPKNWCGMIINARGEVIEDMSFNDASSADRWVDRRLVDAASDCHGEVMSASLTLPSGKPLITLVNRDDAMARLFGRKIGPSTKSQKKSPGRLSGGMRVKESHSTFSGG